MGQCKRVNLETFIETCDGAGDKPPSLPKKPETFAETCKRVVPNPPTLSLEARARQYAVTKYGETPKSEQGLIMYADCQIDYETGFLAALGYIRERVNQPGFGENDDDLEQILKEGEV